MDLNTEIEKVIKKRRVPKWSILKIEAGEEIEKMIKYGIPITKQIELILKYKIVDKLARKEYTDIIIKHFGYKPKSHKPRKTKKARALNKELNELTEKQQFDKHTQKQKAKTQQVAKKSATEKLSKSVNLMESFLKKNS